MSNHFSGKHQRTWSKVLRLPREMDHAPPRSASTFSTMARLSRIHRSIISNHLFASDRATVLRLPHEMDQAFGFDPLALGFDPLQNATPVTFLACSRSVSTPCPKRYHAFRRLPQRASFPISPNGIACMRARRNAESTVITMEILTWTSFFYAWHCNFPCEGHHFCVWSRVIFRTHFRGAFWARGLVRLFILFSLHTFRMLRKTWVGVGWVGWGGM